SGFTHYRNYRAVFWQVARHTHEENACNYFLVTCIFSKYFHKTYTLTGGSPHFQSYYITFFNKKTDVNIENMISENEIFFMRLAWVGRDEI
ncbi:TPA: hypothetical protein ACHVIE_000783, partial [Streptococcus suis]